MVTVIGARAAGAVLVGTVAALVLAGCGSGSSGDAAASGGATTAASSPAASATPTTPLETSSTTASVTPSSPTAKLTTKPAASSTTKAAAPVLVLEPDGIGYLVGTSSIRHVPFGTDAAVVKAVVAKSLGGALTSNDLPDCGQGPRKSAQRAGFSILFDGTKFVGWTDQGAKGRTLTTADGLGIGSTLADVKASIPGVTVSDGTLGAEFTADNGFGGILAGMTATSKVTTVYAGETCFFR